MFFNEIKTFARFPRELVISESSSFCDVFPIDARFFYVTEGNGQIYIDGKTVELPHGSAILINSGVPYRIIPANVKFLAINFDWTQEFCGNNIPITPLPYKSGGELCSFVSITFEDCKELNRFAYCKNAFFLEKALKEMIDRYEKKQIYYHLENDAQTILVLAEFVHQLAVRKTNYFDANAVADYLRSHYNENITNKNIA